MPTLLYRLLITFAIIFQTNTLFAADSLNWQTQFNKAQKIASATKKPMLIYFSGSDWCGWCQKLQREALETKEFASATKEQMILVQVDFPQKNHLPNNIVKQNNLLQKRFSITNFPALVLMDHQGQTIAIFGYKPGDGTVWAKEIHHTIREYENYKRKISDLNSTSFTGKELKRLYQKARELGLEKDAKKIIEKGAQSNSPTFFLSEQYRLAVSSNSDEAKIIRSKLQRLDPENKSLCHYQIAVADFECNCQKQNIKPEETVKPLISYIDKFGKQDKENLWRLQLIISQVFLNENDYEQALRYAKKSKEHAPEMMQKEIASAIEKICCTVEDGAGN